MRVKIFKNERNCLVNLKRGDKPIHDDRLNKLSYNRLNRIKESVLGLEPTTTFLRSIFLSIHIHVKNSANSAKRLSMLCMILLYTVILSGCFLYPSEQEVLAPPLKAPPKVTYATVDVEKGRIEKSINCTGYMVSINKVSLFYKESLGRLKSINVKIGDYVEKGDVLIELDTEDILSDIKISELALRKSEIDLLQKKASEADQYAVLKAQIDIEAKKEEIENLKSKLDLAKLIAPISGEIDYINKDYSVGDRIPAYTDLCRIVDQTQLQLEYTGDKSYEFRLGMEVEVSIKNAPYKGEVVSTPSNMPETLGGKKDTVYIKVVDLPQDIKPGETVRIKLVLEQKDDIYKLPRELVKIYNGRKYVPVLINDMKVEKTVETGIETPTEVEIVSGLKESDKVIIH